MRDVTGNSFKISLIIDYMEGDLRVFLKYILITYVQNIIHSRTIAISQAHIKCYMKMMVDAISYMHSNWILHRVNFIII